MDRNTHDDHACAGCYRGREQRLCPRGRLVRFFYPTMPMPDMLVCGTTPTCHEDYYWPSGWHVVFFAILGARTTEGLGTGKTCYLAVVLRADVTAKFSLFIFPNQVD